MFNPLSYCRPLFVLPVIFTLSSAAFAAVPSDFDGDGRTDIAVFHRAAGTPGLAYWNYVPSSNGTSCASTVTPVSTQWGLSTDRPVPGNYDEDDPGFTLPAITRPGNGQLNWWIYGFSSVVLFGQNADIPVPRDYFAEGYDYQATVRNGLNNLIWYLYQEPDEYYPFVFGLIGDKLVPADYEGDGAADMAVFRPNDGTWYFCRFSDDIDCDSEDTWSVEWGLSTDIPVPGDYDGDGKADVAVFRPSDETWYIKKSSNGNPMYLYWGDSTDIPVPGDYDGDGKFDAAVFRPTDQTWYIQYSGGGNCSRQFGTSTDIPIPALYIPYY